MQWWQYRQHTPRASTPRDPRSSGAVHRMPGLGCAAGCGAQLGELADASTENQVMQAIGTALQFVPHWIPQAFGAVLSYGGLVGSQNEARRNAYYECLRQCPALLIRAGNEMGLPLDKSAPVPASLGADAERLRAWHNEKHYRELILAYGPTHLGTNWDPTPAINRVLAQLDQDAAVWRRNVTAATAAQQGRAASPVEQWLGIGAQGANQAPSALPSWMPLAALGALAFMAVG